jgi:hypothetical protein
MARRTYTTTSRRYVIALDVEPPVALQTWAIVMTRIRDELTQRAPDARVRLACDNDAFVPRVGPQGEAGIAAIPAQATPLLNGTAYPVRLSVSADGYVDDARDVTIPSQPSFPAAFTPLDIGVWNLHRQPVDILGRVELRQPLVPDTIVVGAVITINRLWHQRPTTLAPGPDPFEPLALSAPCIAARPSLGSVAATTMLVTGGPFRLEREAAPGTSAVLLSNTSGLTPGDVLAFEAADVERAEYVAVSSIDGSAGPTQPAIVNLRFPLQRVHRRDVLLDLVTPQPPAATNTIGPAAIAGDRTLLLQSPITAIATGDVVEITGGAAAAEYHIASLATAASDTRGQYRLPPIGRVFQIELKADDGVHTPVLQMVVPEYDAGENRIDFLLN